MELKTKIAVAAGSIGAAAAVMTAAKLMSKNPVFPENFTVTAHTGCDGTKDNTIDSITVAFVSGADIVEFDLNFNSEGIAVLSHDEPNGGEPTLDEAFRYIAMYKNLLVNIDVKNTADLRQVRELAEKHGVLERIFYTGISADTVDAVKEATPGIPYYLNIDVKAGKTTDNAYISSLIDKVKEAGAFGINMKYTACSKKLVDMFHKNGLLVSIWTVSNRFDMKKAMSYGADNITTKKPTVLKGIIANYLDSGFNTTEIEEF